ncbi:MAG: hydrogenase large subunit, partial [Gammaproteobacteria bacterium]
MSGENMKVFEAYLQKLSSRDVAASIDRRALSPAGLLAVEPESWGLCAELARDEGIRWAAAWAEEIDAGFRLNAAFEHRGAYLVLRTRVPREKPELPSHAPYYWAADRCERHIQDMFGIRFKDHPDPRRWTRHQAWSKDQFPLRKDFPVQGAPQDETPPDKDYDFLSAKGPGVYEIPVGPVHAGIIEPGHFRFQAVGETVLNLEERLGYVHKGIEKIAEGRKPDELARLAGRVSGDSTVAHAWAACMAMERAAGIEPTARANFIRAMLCERERIINHLWDMGAICNDVAFTFAYYQLGRLREIWVRDNASIFGHRLLMDRIVPGGINVDPHTEDLARMERSIKALLKELGEIVSLLDFTESLEDRLVTTGILTVET